MSDPKYINVGSIEDCTIEECAELIQALSKVKRFGWENYNPYDPNQTKNYVQVEREIIDVRRRLDQLDEYIKQFKQTIPTKDLTEEENIQMITDFIKGFKI